MAQTSQLPPTIININGNAKSLPSTFTKPLTNEEKKFLLAVERGDLANVKRMLQRSHKFDPNCVDSLGRSAITLAIDGENLEMLELLIAMGLQTKDALLQAINMEFVEAVELLCEHEEAVHQNHEVYSWQRVDKHIATFTPDMTPLILAAHRNNYEILKILLNRGAALPMPHDIKCGCEQCIRNTKENSLRHSLSRVNEYKALASPSLIALSSTDPIRTSFELSWELRNLAYAEPECRSEYLELRLQCQQFAVDLLQQSRSSQELAVILNHDPYEDGAVMRLSRVKLAIEFKQKKFIAHPHIQQLLAAIWYEGVPGFRRKTWLTKVLIIVRVALLFPFYCLMYIFAPNTKYGKLMQKPFMKFLIHASSYFFFLVILSLVSQRADLEILKYFGTEAVQKAIEERIMKHRGNPPTFLEYFVILYVIAFIVEETREIYTVGWCSYLRNLWNAIDFIRNTLYVCVFVLRLAAYIQQSQEIAKDPVKAFIPRQDWIAYDPQLIAEGLFAAANIFSALKLIHLFSINPHLGPLQVSLGRMINDIVKFLFIYGLVLFAFACGLNQLLWYFSDLERKKCFHINDSIPDWEREGEACSKWRSFANVFETSQTLFWASFGMININHFELEGIKTYTRFWGLLMFGFYSVINIIVLLNLLIAMLSNSYAIIDQHSDTEWKFARTKLWMSYFDEKPILPPPFNIIPNSNWFNWFRAKVLKQSSPKTSQSKRQDKENLDSYSNVIRALVWRYITSMHRKYEENFVSEDDINEVKNDISAFRYELLDILNRNGMDVSSAQEKTKFAGAKRMKVWERRLMKDFHVTPVTPMPSEDEVHYSSDSDNHKVVEDSLGRFRRIAKLALLQSNVHKRRKENNVRKPMKEVKINRDKGVTVPVPIEQPDMSRSLVSPKSVNAIQSQRVNFLCCAENEHVSNKLLRQRFFKMCHIGESRENSLEVEETCGNRSDRKLKKGQAQIFPETVYLHGTCTTVTSPNSSFTTE